MIGVKKIISSNLRCKKMAKTFKVVKQRATQSTRSRIKIKTTFTPETFKYMDHATTL